MKKTLYLFVFMLFVTARLSAQDVQPKCLTDSTAAAIIQKMTDAKFSLFKDQMNKISDRKNTAPKSLFIDISLDLFLNRGKTVITYLHASGKPKTKKRLENFIMRLSVFPFSDYTITGYHYYAIEYDRETQDMKVFKFYSDLENNTFIEQVKEVPVEFIHERLKDYLRRAESDSRWFYLSFLGEMEIQYNGKK